MPFEPAGNDGHDNVDGDLIIYQNSEISDPEGRVFKAIKHLGSGHFGRVYEVIIVNPNGDENHLAMKVSRNGDNARGQFQYEAQVLTYVRENLESTCLSHTSLIESCFSYLGHSFIILEMLGPSLLDALDIRGYTGMDLSLIQITLRDILPVLAGLASKFLIHCDVKPENILLENTTSSHVKLIDFGSCCVQGDANFTYVQSRYYRAPEVVLELPFDSKADVWSIGCVAVELMLGLPILPGQNQTHLLSLIEQTIGPFPPSMVDLSPKRDVYFTDDYQVKSLETFQHELGIEMPDFVPYFLHQQLDDIVLNYQYQSDDVKKERENRRIFLDLIHRMLELDPAARISASDALRHPFMQLKFNI